MIESSNMTISHVMHLFYTLQVIFISSMIEMSFGSVDGQRTAHIVYMGSLPEGEYLARSYHISMLQALGHTSKMVDKTLIRSYTRSFNGFAANLNREEVLKLKTMKGVVSVFKNHEFQIQTTRSWDYVGMSLKVPRNPIVESDIIIGHFDGGVLPESHSFSDHGLGPIPKKWKGACQGGKDFVCNKKLIGARFYTAIFGNSAIDTDGHGTHTASTAVGSIVKNASFLGIANGVARGGVPSARLATYKVCAFGCTTDAILAAFDDAIADNVDIITVSLNNDTLNNITDNSIAIGSFHAMEKGILTVQSAGNQGELGFGSINSIVPWVFTAAASTDRTINNKLILGNGRTLMSTCVNAFDMFHPKKLAYGRSTSRNCSKSFAKQCTPECVDRHLVNGKILICDSLDTEVIHTAESVGASGVVLRGDGKFRKIPRIVALPTAILSDSDFHHVKSYLKSKLVHSARILKSKIFRNLTPRVPYYSNRGPNRILPQIFKPDITAPGTAILAAFIPYINPSDFGSVSKTFKTNYTFMSGTSMSCPHVAGAVAYVKSKHPDWSISAIKSSLMTSASNMNSKYNLDDELGYGAGHIDPLKAVHPGLVYETFIEDYFKMFCSLGSEGDKLRKMFKGKKKCPKEIRMSPKDLNYPAMTTSVHKNSIFNVKFLRVVTNVGHSNSTYVAEISTGDNMIYVNVEPSILSFVNLKEKKSFVVTVSGKWSNQDHVSCSLIWFDGAHRVRSPILLYASSII